MPVIRQEKELKRQQKLPLSGLLLAKRFAVGTCIHSGVSLVGAYLDLLQRAVVGIITVVCALGNGALNALVCVTVHSQFLLLFEFGISMASGKKIIQAKFSFFATQN